MKVLFVAPVPPPYGGIANWTRIVLGQTEKNGIESEIVNTAVAKRPTDGQTIFDRVFGAGFQLFEIVRKLKHILKTEKIDVCHLTTSGGLGSIRNLCCQRLLKKRGIPIVLHIHNGRYPAVKKRGGPNLKLMNRIIRSADTVISIDMATQRQLLSVNPNSVYVPNPINLEPIDALRQEKALPREKIVLFAGWVIKTKGIEELLQAWGILEKEFPDWKLEIFGPVLGDYLSYLKESYPVQRVKYGGEVLHTDIITEMQRSSILVLPSYTEGFPNVILEAMATENAIVATDVGGIPEMLNDNAGVLIKSKDTEGLTVQLRKLMSDTALTDKFADTALLRVHSTFSADIVFEKYKSIWEKLRTR